MGIFGRTHSDLYYFTFLLSYHDKSSFFSSLLFSFIRLASNQKLYIRFPPWFLVSRIISTRLRDLSRHWCLRPANCHPPSSSFLYPKFVISNTFIIPSLMSSASSRNTHESLHIHYITQIILTHLDVYKNSRNSLASSIWSPNLWSSDEICQCANYTPPLLHVIQLSTRVLNLWFSDDRRQCVNYTPRITTRNPVLSSVNRIWSRFFTEDSWNCYPHTTPLLVCLEVFVFFVNALIQSIWTDCSWT